MTIDTAHALAELTRDLCAVPSETGEERAIADLVERRCRAAAGEASVRRIGNSVVCRPPGTGDGPHIALVGHLDTVRCAEHQPNLVEGGRVYGCGASDMKAGVAVMLRLLDEWREMSAFRPVWIFYDREEGPHDENGLGPVMESGVLPPLDFAFVLEPTDRTVQMGCMGTLHATVTVRGKRAHSARPWQGENAIANAIPLLERLTSRGRREVRIGNLSFYEVVTVTGARTRNSSNVVPDALELNVNVRFAPGRTSGEAEAELRDLVGDEASVTVIDAAPAGDVHLDHPLIGAWVREEEIEILPKQAWTDVARFTERGIAAVNFGPGETAQAHQAGEWCSVESLEFVHAALRRYLTGQAAVGAGT